MLFKTKKQATPSVWRPRLVVYTLTKVSGVFQYIYQRSNLFFWTPDLTPWDIVVGVLCDLALMSTSQGP